MKKPVKKTLFGNAAAYASGAFLQQATGFILIFLLAPFLSTRDLGITNTLAVWTAILSIVMGLQLHGAISRFYWEHQNDVTRWKKFLGSVWIFQFCVSLLVVVPLCCWPGWWESWQEGKLISERIPFLPYVPLALAASMFSGIASIPMALLQAKQEATRYVRLSILRIFVSVPVSMILVAILGFGATGMLIAQLMGALIVLGKIVYELRDELLPKCFSKEDVKTAIKFSFPLLPHALGAWFLVSADRAVLDRYVCLSALGAYGLAVSVSLCFESISSSVNNAWQPHYFKLMKENSNRDAEIKRCLTLYGLGYGLFCLAGILFSGEVLHLVLPTKHHAAIAVIAPLLFARLWGGWYYFASSPMFYFQRTKMIPILTITAGAIGVGLNIWLIPIYGVRAAGWNAVVSGCVMFWLFHANSRIYQVLPFAWRQMAVIAVCGLFGAISGEFFAVWQWAGLLTKFSLLACATWVTLPIIRRAANSVKNDASLVPKSLTSA